MDIQDKIKYMLHEAHRGSRLIGVNADGTKITLFKGVGNQSGMHDAAEIERLVKFNKAVSLLTKKLEKFTGERIEMFSFVNITRDRGRWMRYSSFNW